MTNQREETPFAIKYIALYGYEPMKNNFASKTYIHLLIIAVAGFLVYSNTFQVPFLFDDLTSIMENPVIKEMKNFLLNASGYHYNPRRFLGYLTFALNYRIGGLDVTGYHVFNLAVHIISALLLYALIRLTFRTPVMRESSLSPYSGLIALCAALFFVVHPLQTQAVTYIVQRLTSLTALLYLLSLCLYAKWRVARDEYPSQGKKALPLYVLCLITIVLAMKTKEIAFTLPFMVVLYEFCFFRQRKFVWLVPVLLTLAIIPMSLLNLEKPVSVVLSDVTEVTKVQAQVSRWVYLMTQFTVITTYIRLLFFPVNQNLDYDYPLRDAFFTAPVILSFLFLSAIVGLALYFFFRSGRKNGESRGELRLVSFGIFWFFIALSVESSIIPIVDPIFEHRTYLPSAGFFIACITGLAMIVRELNSKAAVKVISAVVITAIVVLGGTTYARNRVWQNETTLWEDVVKKSPFKTRPHYNLGVAYTKEERTPESIKEFLTAIQMQPDDFKAHNNLGLAYSRQGRMDDAIEAYVKAIRINPDYFESYYNLGIAYTAQGNVNQAIQEYLKAIRINPDSVDSHYNLGVAYAKLGQTDKAIEAYLSAIKIDPDYFMAYNNLANEYSALGRTNDAIKAYLMAIEINPEVATIHYNLALMYTAQKRTEESINELLETIRINPEYYEAHYNLGIAYASMGRMESAIEAYRTAVGINPRSYRAYNNLGILYGRQRRTNEAIEAFLKAIEINSEYVEGLYNLGITYRVQGRLDEAVREFQTVLKLNPDHAGARRNLDKIQLMER